MGLSLGLERREVEKRIYGKETMMGIIVSSEGKRLTASAALHVYKITYNFEQVITHL